jgi:hypothetical protein
MSTYHAESSRHQEISAARRKSFLLAALLALLALSARAADAKPQAVLVSTSPVRTPAEQAGPAALALDLGPAAQKAAALVRERVPVSSSVVVMPLRDVSSGVSPFDSYFNASLKTALASGGKGPTLYDSASKKSDFALYGVAADIGTAVDFNVLLKERSSERVVGGFSERVSREAPHPAQAASPAAPAPGPGPVGLPALLNPAKRVAKTLSLWALAGGIVDERTPQFAPGVRLRLDKQRIDLEAVWNPSYTVTYHRSSSDGPFLVSETHSTVVKSFELKAAYRWRFAPRRWGSTEVVPSARAVAGALFMHVDAAHGLSPISAPLRATSNNDSFDRVKPIMGVGVQAQLGRYFEPGLAIEYIHRRDPTYKVGGVRALVTLGVRML